MRLELLQNREQRGCQLIRLGDSTRGNEQNSSPNRVFFKAFIFATRYTLNKQAMSFNARTAMASSEKIKKKKSYFPMIHTLFKLFLFLLSVLIFNTSVFKNVLTFLILNLILYSSVAYQLCFPPAILIPNLTLLLLPGPSLVPTNLSPLYTPILLPILC